MAIDPTPATTSAQSVHLKGGAHGVLLFHGLSSSPLELMFLARGLQRAGHTVRVPVMSGYTYGEGRTLGAQDWVTSALAELDTLLATCDEVTVGGLCLGSVLAMQVAALRPGKVKALICLSPALHYDGWGNPWYTPLLPLARWVPFARRIRIREREPYGLKDERMRAWVAKQMKQAGESDAGAASLQVGDILQARELIARSRRALPLIQCPTLVVHAKEDENATPRSAYEVIEHVSSDVARLVLLQDSYHMISIDREKETVLSEMKDFLANLDDRADTAPPVQGARVLPLFADAAAGQGTQGKQA